MRCRLILTLAVVSLLAGGPWALAQAVEAVPVPVPVPGADQMEKYVPLLQGKRVGLVVNQTSIIDGKPSLDVLVEKGVKVTKVFGPEHGFRGNASAGTHVGDEVDAKTGVKVVSLYGKKRKPTGEDLADVDVLVFDIQDMGVRFYTNINTLRDVMEAAAEFGKELVILDRPNPHGYMVDGPVLDMKYESGIGRFPLPIAHGLTVGEFAGMVKGEGWMKGAEKLRFSVVKVGGGYTHDTPYVLPVNPSPNLNTAQGVALYPATCLFEGVNVNHGRGTMKPFVVIGSPELKGKYAFSFTPVGIPGMSENPIFKDQVCYGLDLSGVDPDGMRKTGKVNLSWIFELYAASPNKGAFFFTQKTHPNVVNIEKLVGSGEFAGQVAAGMSEAEIRKTWEPGLAKYREMRKTYLLYP